MSNAIQRLGSDFGLDWFLVVVVGQNKYANRRIKSKTAISSINGNQNDSKIRYMDSSEVVANGLDFCLGSTRCS